jgi:DNA-binding CsgD family transcriptional regulator
VDASAQGFVKAVEAIYGAAAEPSRWPGALWAIARCFGDVGAAISYQRDDGSLGAIVSPGMEPGQREYDEYWWQQDIRFKRGHEMGFVAAGDTITDRHVVTETEIETHPFYAQFLAGYGLRWFAGTSISPDPSMRAVISIQRVAQRSPYSDDELALLARLGRHVEASLRLGIRLMDAELAALSLGDALARLGVGAFLLDGSGRVLFANPAGDRLIGAGLMIRNRRLSAIGSAQHGALDAAVKATLADTPQAWGGSQHPVLLDGGGAHRFLAAYVLPVRARTDHPADLVLRNARALVVVLGSGPADPPDPSIVRDLLGLTLGEARVASLVGHGLAPRDAAEKLGIAEETARNTLKRVFAKIGVSRQSELASLLSNLVLR